MTEYDYSPDAYRQFERTQRRIANWADDTAAHSSQFKSPFAPRSDVHKNEFYNPRSSSSSPHRHSPSPSHSSGHRRTPQRSYSYGYPAQTQPAVSSPLRSNTVSPNDSISQVTGPSHRSSGRSHSHSPTRHTSSRRHHRSGTGTYVISPGGPQYTTHYVQAPQPMQYAAMPMQQPQPAAYVVYPRDRKVQIVYPEPQPAAYAAAHPSPAPPNGSFLTRIFSSGGKKSRRSRSLSTSRSRW